MPRELVNAHITHVSYVGKGANQKPFFFTKSEDNPTLKKDVKIFVNKATEEQQLVYGIVYEPDVEDAHGDYMTATEIEKAAHGFLKDARNVDNEHDFEAGAGEVVESYIAPTDFELGEHEVKKGAWVLVTKATEEIWEEVKKGTITGYSMAGTATTIEKKQNEKPTDVDEVTARGFFDLVKDFFTKGEVRDNYSNNQRTRNIWAAWNSLESVFYDCLWDNDTADIADFEKLKENANEFVELIGEIQTEGDVLKALEERKDDEEMKTEEFAKLLDEKLGQITKRLDGFEKGEEGEEETPNAEAGELANLLNEKLSPITKRLEKLEKVRGVSKQADLDEEEIEKTEGSVWDGLL